VEELALQLRKHHEINHYATRGGFLAGTFAGYRGEGKTELE
jgi:hypothetical protein